MQLIFATLLLSLTVTVNAFSVVQKQQVQISSFSRASQLKRSRITSNVQIIDSKYRSDSFVIYSSKDAGEKSSIAKSLKNFATAVKNIIVSFFTFIINALLSPFKFFATKKSKFFKIQSTPAAPTPAPPAVKAVSSADKKEVAAMLEEIEKRKVEAKMPGRWPPWVDPPQKPKRSVADLSDEELFGKRVLVRCDLNVPLSKDLTITDDTRIRGSIPTIEYLVSKGAKVLLTSHLGRPKNGYEKKFSLAPVAPRLSELLKQEVKLVPDCIGMAVQKELATMTNGQVALLENSRFYLEEEKNDPVFAADLASNIDVFVNDAFGTAHRAHASTEGVTAFVKPSVAGFLLQKELDYLQGAVDQPVRPFCAIVGGSKVSSKISVIEAMLSKVDKLILGGGMVFTFLKARGVDVGASLVEDDQLELATRLEAIAKEKGVKLYLATDIIVADKFAADANTQIVDVNSIPAGWMGLDIGPKTLKDLQGALADCKTVIWNGPMGVFEMEAFAKGTLGISTTLSELTGKGCITIIGGGDSVAAVEQAGLAENMSHISTGGGASLELLEGKVLPGIAALDE